MKAFRATCKATSNKCPNDLAATRAAGFIGGNLIDCLLASKFIIHRRVRTYNRFCSARRRTRMGDGAANRW